MSEDNKLISLLKEKYNTPLDGQDCITFPHMLLVIKTIREQDNKALTEAYEQLQSSSKFYDEGCDIIRKLL